MVNLLTGLGGARLERCRGWTPIHDLDDKAVVAAMRIFEDARQFQGLLGRAVQQLLLNWENTSGSRLRTPIFPELPSVNTESFRLLLRT